MNCCVYRVAPGATFRIVSPTEVEATVGGKTREIRLAAYQLALEFATPSRIDAVRSCIESDLGDDELDDLVTTLHEFGVLEEMSRSSDGPSLAGALRSGLGTSASFTERVSRELADGRAVVIPDAFPAEMAERVHGTLIASDAWMAHERLGAPHFHYHHHNIYDRSRFPRELLECERLFGSSSTKSLIGRWSAKNCDGAVAMSASLYLPGDHSLPHTDWDGLRSVSYVWHLSKDWQSDWGGHLVWCPSGAMVTPQFNSLILFSVSPSSMHFVSVVAPHARGNRLSVNGWWQCGAPTEFSDRTPPRDFSEFGVAPGTYGRETVFAGDAGDILIL